MRMMLGGYEVYVIYKQIRHTYLRVKKDGTLQITTHAGVSESRLRSFVESKRNWIENRLSAAPPCANKGVVHLFGVPHQVVFLDEAEGETYSQNGTLYVVGNEVGLKAYLEKILKAKLTASMERLTKEMGLTPPPSFRIREMKTRWGSCHTGKRKITFNLQLVYAPHAVVDYVVVHELCHLWIPNHSPAFYDRVKQYFPNYKEARAALKCIVPYPFGQSKEN